MDDIHAEHPTHGNPSSMAKIGGHPIHPMLVPFPIVCFVGTFATADRPQPATRPPEQ